jgi:hypothetical protein
MISARPQAALKIRATDAGQRQELNLVSGTVEGQRYRQQDTPASWSGEAPVKLSIAGTPFPATVKVQNQISVHQNPAQAILTNYQHNTWTSASPPWPASPDRCRTAGFGAPLPAGRGGWWALPYARPDPCPGPRRGRRGHAAGNRPLPVHRPLGGPPPPTVRCARGLAADVAGCQPEAPTGLDVALAWFDAEHQCLLAAVDTAAEHGWHDVVWYLARTLTTYHHRRDHADADIRTWGLALRARTPGPALVTLNRPGFGRDSLLGSGDQTGHGAAGAR